MLCEFASGARGTFEASRTIVGPESQNAFDVYGTKGALGWNLEQLNELRALPGRRRAAHRLPHGVRRRPLPLPRRLRAGQRERHRLRGPRRDRGLRVLPRDRRAAARSRRASPRRSTGSRCRRRCCARRSRGAGRTSCRCGSTDAGHAGACRARRPPTRPRGRCGSGSSASGASGACTPSCSRAGCRAPRWPWSTTSPPRRPTPLGGRARRARRGQRRRAAALQTTSTPSRSARRPTPTPT